MKHTLSRVAETWPGGKRQTVAEIKFTQVLYLRTNFASIKIDLDTLIVALLH